MTHRRVEPSLTETNTSSQNRNKKVELKEYDVRTQDTTYAQFLEHCRENLPEGGISIPWRQVAIISPLFTDSDSWR